MVSFFLWFLGLQATADQCQFNLSDSSFAKSFAGDKKITSPNIFNYGGRGIFNMLQQVTGLAHNCLAGNEGIRQICEQEGTFLVTTFVAIQQGHNEARIQEHRHHVP